MQHEEPLRNTLAGHAEMLRKPGSPPAFLEKPLRHVLTPREKGRLPPFIQKELVSDFGFSQSSRNPSHRLLRKPARIFAQCLLYSVNVGRSRVVLIFESCRTNCNYP